MNKLLLLFFPLVCLLTPTDNFMAFDEDTRAARESSRESSEMSYTRSRLTKKKIRLQEEENEKSMQKCVKKTLATVNFNNLLRKRIYHEQEIKDLNEQIDLLKNKDFKTNILQTNLKYKKLLLRATNDELKNRFFESINDKKIKQQIRDALQGITDRNSLVYADSCCSLSIKILLEDPGLYRSTKMKQNLQYQYCLSNAIRHSLSSRR